MIPETACQRCWTSGKFDHISSLVDMVLTKWWSMYLMCNIVTKKFHSTTTTEQTWWINSLIGVCPKQPLQTFATVLNKACPNRTNGRSLVAGYQVPWSWFTLVWSVYLNSGILMSHHSNSIWIHCNMQSTYELLTSDFVELEMAFRDCVKGITSSTKSDVSNLKVDCIIFRYCWMMVIELHFHKEIFQF